MYFLDRRQHLALHVFCTTFSSCRFQLPLFVTVTAHPFSSLLFPRRWRKTCLKLVLHAIYPLCCVGPSLWLSRPSAARGQSNSWFRGRAAVQLGTKFAYQIRLIVGVSQTRRPQSANVRTFVRPNPKRPRTVLLALITWLNKIHQRGEYHRI